MFLKKLEITGFKSFAKKTILDFSSGGVFSGGETRGITAIVGPNGSGKSNVADALRWVLGEQSMKNIRGKKAQDMIFAGSGSKSQLGSAQVSVYLDNSDKRIPLDYEEVVITRRIYRSGESEYLINGSRVRLLDVVDLLAKAGVSQHSYAIINQGMADYVLNATPFERRSVIEEAAGVKEFQIKKERSQKKLKATRVNLEQVRQLLIEIEPHLKLLKRQSQRAQKGEEYRKLLKEKQMELFGFMLRTNRNAMEHARQACEIIEREMASFQKQLDELVVALRNETGKSGNVQQEISELEDAQRQLSHKLYELDRKLVFEEGKLELERERGKSIKTVDVIPVGAELIRKKLSELFGAQKELVKKIWAVKSLEELKVIKGNADHIASQMKELCDGMEKGRIEKQKPSEEIEKQRAINLDRVKEILDGVTEFKKQRLVLENEMTAMRKKIADLFKQDRDERKAAIELEDAIRRKQFEYDKLKERHNSAKIETAKLEVKSEDLIERIKREMAVDANNISYDGGPVNIDECEREIYRLKFQLDQIGGIDETVLQEYEETQKRYDFLSKESEDLEEAMKRLAEVSREMDRKIKDEFEATFSQISKDFSHYFNVIFSGGKAELKKIETSNLQRQSLGGDGKIEVVDDGDSRDHDVQLGIEIMAEPPGKKIGNLSMLSGGERTLTSLALLFAIIAHNPPPFALLDEVEAALDEANSRRFGKILNELSGRTQFVLITHNRQTMREASVLYGVTMQDDGISKLLSVKLEQIGEEGKINR